MKKVIFALTLILGFISCSSGENSAIQAKSPEKDYVKVIYFHGKQRCASCVAIEQNVKDVINSQFADEVKKGKLVFKTVDISTPEGEELGDKYEVTWSSLFINKWHDGKEERNNLTKFAFNNAKDNPTVFKKEIAKKISELLK